MDDKREAIIEWFEGILLLPCAGLVISGVAVLAYQMYLWLRNGYWTSFSALLLLRRVLPAQFFLWVKNSDWHGVKKIILFVLDSSLAGFLIVSGVVLFFALFLTIGNLLERQRKQSPNRAYAKPGDT